MLAIGSSIPYDRIVPTPYDNYDPGYSAEERRIAANYDIDLDAHEQARCYSCFAYFDADMLNKAGNCPDCAALIRSEEALAFMSAPTMAGCKALMATSADIAKAIIRDAQGAR